MHTINGVFNTIVNKNYIPLTFNEVNEMFEPVVEEAEEMTMTQLCTELGRPIKIVEDVT